MARSVKEIEQEVRSLRVAERNQLLRDLIADIDSKSEREIEQAWLQEARRRYREIQDGLVESVPATAVIQKARARLKNEGWVPSSGRGRVY
jgi:hypothetical protein